jgi:hypothetical protein
MGLAPSGLRIPAPASELPEGDSVINLDDLGLDQPTGSELARVEFPDGSVSINFGSMSGEPDEESKEHTANLAQHLDDGTLGGIADELLRLIDEDARRQQKRLEDIAKGIDLLGIKLEEPKTEPNEEGISVVRHPLLLEAVLRFQANARGELLPADGPVKVRDDGSQGLSEEDEANKLAKDFNHYLTAVATEYYPDMDRMLFSLGFGGEAYKKVYNDPLKRRPVAQTIDRKDLILADGAVSLEHCKRVTHRVIMAPSDVRRMMLLGAWRKIQLGYPSLEQPLITDQKLSDISGVELKTTVEENEQDHTIYECYCELNLKGFEHKDDGDETGLALPYRVTMDKDTRQVLEIRRWWREGDEAFLRKEVFVEYVFVPAFPGVNIGLLHILGNASRALTAAWRIALDNGMLANFPGGIMARTSGRQQTTNIRVAPGQVAPIDVDGGDIRTSFANLPYRDVTTGFVQIIQDIENVSQRVGGTAETSTGEGRAEAPVGTTIALIDQATKVLSAVHKRLHQAQSKEFELLRDLFKDDPTALHRGNKSPNLPTDEASVTAALRDNNLVPAADPNTSSQSMRIQKAISLYSLAKENPPMFDQQAVYRRLLTMVGYEDVDELFNKNPQPAGPQIDPAKQKQADAQMLTAQAKMAETQAKAQSGAFAPATGVNPAELQIKAQAEQTKALDSQADNQNRAADRQAKLDIERMKLERERMIHEQGQANDRQKHLEELNHESATHNAGLMVERQGHLERLAHDHQVHKDHMDLEDARLRQAMATASAKDNARKDS